jgi:hypothetical protein
MTFKAYQLEFECVFFNFFNWFNYILSFIKLTKLFVYPFKFNLINDQNNLKWNLNWIMNPNYYTLKIYKWKHCEPSQAFFLIYIIFFFYWVFKLISSPLFFFICILFFYCSFKLFFNLHLSFLLGSYASHLTIVNLVFKIDFLQIMKMCLEL